MNNKEREEFWEVLLNATNINDSEKINSKIIYPEKLYRYRSIDTKTLNALAENKLYFSTSNYYDDPFDTFIRIDVQKIRNIAQCFENKNLPAQFMNLFDLIPEQNLAKENIKVIVDEVIKFTKETRNEIRKWYWSLCFTEKYCNETLWLKYANNHKGFVLEYEIVNLKNAKFNSEMSALCMVNNVNLTLYPVYYSKDQNGYDSTNYAGFVNFCHLQEKMGNTECVKLLSSQVNFAWEMERVLLIKKWIHHYDEEWRMILNSPYRIESIAKPCIICKPSKIILGLKISDNDKKCVLMAAEKAKIDSIEQMIVNDNDEFVSEKI